MLDENKVCKLPYSLDWVSASMISCADVTAWVTLSGMVISQTVLIQVNILHPVTTRLSK